ncbi:hypothetical protein [Nocardiopsis coralli]|uniref:hypothetical protein n=1 Tax=Nocardiopsis coralli TaxID=2772213 RepID=UPI0018689A0E|nr:hypothetical protein [Nocardiopsis coralli]
MEAENGPASGRKLSGSVSASSGRFARDRRLTEAGLLEERDDAEAAHVWDEAGAGQEPIHTREEMWAGDR